LNKSITLKTMTTLNPCTGGLRLMLLAFITAGMALVTYAPGEETPKPKKTSTAGKPEKRPARTLSGAELYAINCNRCHPERYAPERTAEQWKTILLHMRTRANLPAAQARAILQFLQEDSGK
jgi:hypothetical protein